MFWRQWDALLHYLNVAYLALLASFWYDLVAAGKGYFQPTLEESCRATAHRLGLYIPVTSHIVSDMVIDFCFSVCNYGALMDRSSTFLFVMRMDAVDERLRTKEKI